MLVELALSPICLKFFYFKIYLLSMHPPYGGATNSQDIPHLGDVESDAFIYIYFTIYSGK